MKKLKAAVNVNIAMLSHCYTDRRLPCCLHFTLCKQLENTYLFSLYADTIIKQTDRFI